MHIEPIDDLDDPRVSVYRDVRDFALRDAEGLFMVESRLCVRRLLELGRHAVCSVFVTEAALAALRDALERADPELRVFVAHADVLQRVVGYNLHRGCIAVAQRPAVLGLDDLLAARPRRLVGLECVANPENVGNVFRNAMAFGADGVILSDDCADPLYRKSVRVSMAGSLVTPYAAVADWSRSLAELRTAGVFTVALSTAADAIELDRFDPGAHAAIALLLGAEGEGLREATRAAADLSVRIPMAAGIDSLNVATASGIALHHCFAAVDDAGQQRDHGPAAYAISRNGPSTS